MYTEHTSKHQQIMAPVCLPIMSSGIKKKKTNKTPHQCKLHPIWRGVVVYGENKTSAGKLSQEIKWRIRIVIEFKCAAGVWNGIHKTRITEEWPLSTVSVILMFTHPRNQSQLVSIETRCFPFRPFLNCLKEAQPNSAFSSNRPHSSVMSDLTTFLAM